MHDHDEHCHDRIIIGIVLGQLLWTALSKPEYVMLVIEDVIRKWREHLTARERDGLPAHLPSPPGEMTPLHQFVDGYTLAIEGNVDLPDDERARVWFAHARRLAPSEHWMHDDADVWHGSDRGAYRTDGWGLVHAAP